MKDHLLCLRYSKFHQDRLGSFRDQRIHNFFGLYFSDDLLKFLLHFSFRLRLKMFRNLVNLTNKYKVLRGMISYGTLWPCGCLIEQTLIEKRTFRTYDWMKCLRWDKRLSASLVWSLQALIEESFLFVLQI